MNNVSISPANEWIGSPEKKKAFSVYAELAVVTNDATPLTAA